MESIYYLLFITCMILWTIRRSMNLLEKRMIVRLFGRVDEEFQPPEDEEEEASNDDEDANDEDIDQS